MSGYHSLSHDSLTASALALRLSHPFRGESVRASQSGSDPAAAVPGREKVGEHVPAVVAHEADDSLIVRCPYCHLHHVHGSAGGHGLRLSHCRDGARPYVLIERENHDPAQIG
jgi:hypothetical protein